MRLSLVNKLSVFGLKSEDRPLPVARQKAVNRKISNNIITHFCEKGRYFMNFSKLNDDPVIGICWNCGKEIRLHDSTSLINDEIWCERCAGSEVKLYVEGERDE